MKFRLKVTKDSETSNYLLGIEVTSIFRRRRVAGDAGYREASNHLRGTEVQARDARFRDVKLSSW